MADADWRMFGAATLADGAKNGHDVMKPFRDSAYANGIPWTLGPTQINSQTIGVLLRSMAKTFDDGHQLARLFDFMNETRSHGWPTATVQAGEALIARAERKRGTLPLPSDWVGYAQVAAVRGKNSSGGYWAGAMLRAGGHHAPGHDRDDPHQGVA